MVDHMQEQDPADRPNHQDGAPRAPGAGDTRVHGSMHGTMHGAVGQVRAMFRFHGPYRVLHLTWIAFFLSFVVWFDFAPFAATIGDRFGLSKGQLLTLGLCNVALTVPARIFVGMALDRFGPRRVYSAILVFAVVPNTMFALAQSFEMMVVSRLLLSVVGAGFVVGIRMVSEWFPPHELGTAEGVYGGWGNFGAAAAAFSLPALAGWVGGEDGWRWAMIAAGVVAAAYGVAYSRLVTDTPHGVAYARAKKAGALEVTSRKAVFGLAALTVPLWCALAVILLRVFSAGVIGTVGLTIGLATTALLLGTQLVTIFRVNRAALASSSADGAGAYPEQDQYPFRSVAVLSLAYLCTFGAELAVVTMLPDFFAETWGLGPAVAGLAASSAAFLNLVSRPAGGLISDLSGDRRRTLSVILVGVCLGYLAMATLGPAWPVPLAIVLSLVCSGFGQAGNGAVYAIVPLVKKRVSGQISGIAGAYGNVGGILFLTALTVVGPRWFFVIISASALAALIATRWLVVPAAPQPLTVNDVVDLTSDRLPTRVGGSLPTPLGAVTR